MDLKHLGLKPGAMDKIERGKDVSELFARALARADIAKALESQNGYYLYDGNGRAIAMVTPRGVQQLSPMQGPQAPMMSAPPSPIAPISKSQGDQFRSMGQKSRSDQDQDEMDGELEKFIHSASESEINNLVDLSTDRMIVEQAKVEVIHKNGEEVGVERLLDLGLVKFEKYDGMIEFRITPTGRRVLQYLKQ